MKLFVLCLLIFLTACAETPTKDPSIREPEARIYHDEFDRVWRAIHLALRKYPIQIDNRESGIIETNYIKGDRLFSDPNENAPKNGVRYKLILRIVKGKTNAGSAIKVTILKNVEVQPDFFSGFQSIATDGLEETTVLYRIGRFLEIDTLISRSGN